MTAELRRLLEAVRNGEIDVDAAAAQLTSDASPGTLAGPVGDFAMVDHDRVRRCGHAEVVFCPGKEPADAAAIAAEILERSPRVLLTRADQEHADAVTARLPDAVWHQRARCITVDREPTPREGLVAVVAAGTADLPVAEEARVTLELFGSAVRTHYDIGVAGIHRLDSHLAAIREARCVVVAAGMDGALPSVVGGLVSAPVIAAPTSVGYGASFGGLAALLCMLNACAAGVGVVNIDNGFGAGYLAGLINRPTRAPRS